MSEKLMNKVTKLVKKVKFDKAIDLLKEFLEINQNSAIIWSYLAQIYMLKGDFENVIHHANKALEIEPNLKSAMNQLFLACDQTKNYDKEWNLLERYVQIHDLSVLQSKKIIQFFPLHQVPHIYYLLKIFDDPDYLNQFVIGINPLVIKNPYLQQMFKDAAISKDQNKFEQLYTLYLIFNLPPTNIIEFFLLSSFKLSKILYSEKKKDVVDLLITLFPEKMESWTLLGTYYIEKEKHDKAIEVLKKAIAIYPKSYLNWYYLGDVYSIKKDYHNACECYGNALDLAPKAKLTGDVSKIALANSIKRELLYPLGLAHVRCKRYIEALGILLEDLKAEPEKKESWILLALIYNQIGEYDKAIEASRNSLIGNPHLATPWSHMGYSYYKKGDIGKATELITKSIELDPNHAFAIYYLARIHFDSGKFEEALESCEKCLTIDPEFKEATELQKTIEEKLNKV